MKVCPNCNLRYPDESERCLADRTPLVHAEDPMLGRLLAGRYRIEAPIGEGGMATVYRARQTLQDKLVAIKVFRPDLAKDEKLRERFRREATSTARLAHPNIIEIMDSGQTDEGTPYLVMEMLVGESLESVMGRGKMRIARAVDIVMQTLSALARAHDFQVIHRDLKPDNLFVCRTDRNRDFVKILDFGIARSMHDPRLTGAGEVFGTPQYMAPERITSIDAGPAADLYAIGIILYELTAGVLPFDAPNISGWLMKHMREVPKPPSTHDATIPPALDALVLQLLEKDPGKRPVDAHAVISRLGAIQSQLPEVVLSERPSMVPFENATTAVGPKRDGAGHAPISIATWHKRAEIFGQMLERAFPAGKCPAAYTARIAAVRTNVARLAVLREQTMREQTTLEAVAARTREAQGRFGRAMDTLGQDLSRSRQDVQQAREYEKRFAARSLELSAPFASMHKRIQSLAPVATPDTLAHYRAATEALEQALAANPEHAQAEAWLRMKEREVTDTEFQIAQMRAQLERLSNAGEEECAVIGKRIAIAGNELVQLEQGMMRTSIELTATLRGRPGLGDLFAQLDAAT